MPKPVAGRPGWVEGSAEDLLGLSPEEAALVQLRLDLADAVRERRASLHMTQAELARRTGSTQPRVARLERGDASLEALARAMLAMGARRSDLGVLVARGVKRRRARGGRKARRG